MVRRQKKRRRGVVILVVLSLLVLFVLLVVTFAIVAGQFKSAAKASADQGLYDDDPERLTHQAFLQLMRDTSNVKSVIRNHSLLRDMYGGDGFAAYAADAGVAPTSGGEFLDIAVYAQQTPGWPVPLLVGTNGQTVALSQSDNYYSGCVLTFTSGPAKNISTRIVGYDYNPAAVANRRFILRVMSFRGPQNNLISPVDPNGSVPHRFVVNGRPFNGTGMGFDASPPSTSARLTVTNLNYGESALLPNYSVNANPGFDGGADECYDAPDYQNMFLGMVLPTPNGSRGILPSFHRPALIHYWKTREPTWATNNALRRRVVLRPLDEDPNDLAEFTGSNDNFTVDGVDGFANWDVDNDGDGIPDSIWIDIGMPVITTEDGRQYKPLFAFLCTDMDGRLNLNAHGTPLWSAAATPPVPVNVIGGTTAGLQRGQGYGPPEVDLQVPNLFTAAEVTQIMQTRYGSVNLQPGRNGIDPMSRIRFSELQGNYFAPVMRSSYYSPPDYHAELRMGINALGQPVYEASTQPDALADSPYEMDFSLNRPAGDLPFTPGALERVLRPNDLDLNVRSNLLEQLATFDTSWDERRLVTTDSFDLPTPNVMAAGSLATAFQQAASNSQQSRAYHITDLLKIRLAASGVFTAEEELNIQIKKMLSWDLIQGLRMDLNRPLGNGRDDNNNNVVDEPQEVGVPETVWSTIAQASYLNVPMDHVNGVRVTDPNPTPTAPFNQPTIADKASARHLLSRHLYVLAMILTDKSINPTTAKEMAQWAVNVVDFRDPDSIMTPFEYDINPFDGWGVDGIVDGYLGGPSPNVDDANPQRGLVWGVERPELLITETLAFHAHGTRDTALDPSMDTIADGDAHRDQSFLPRVGTFIELYNPWTGTETTLTPPGELYAGGGVRIDSRTPAGQPVWRLIFRYEKEDAAVTTNNPPNPDETNFGNVERAAYFVPQAIGEAAVNALPAFATVAGRRRYYSTFGYNPIAPGQYAVVGSMGNEENANQFVTRMGHSTTAPADDRRIVLDQANNVVRLFSVGAWQNRPAIPITMNQSNLPPVADPAVDPLRRVYFSVSERLDGYPIYTAALPHSSGAYMDPATEQLVDGAGAPKPLTTPFDRMGPNGQKPHEQDIFRNGVTQSFCRVYLQRIADPLQNWHAGANPYRTIDSMTINLASFSGADSFSNDQGLAPADHDDRFSSIERGETERRNAGLSPAQRNRLWRMEPPTGGIPSVADGTQYFPFQLTATLGAVNASYLANANIPFPWLVWQNRPFISQYELLQVPDTNCFDLLKEFLPGRTGTPYDEIDRSSRQFGHLANFFDQHGGTPNITNDDRHLYRVLEYTHVPSRFNGTETVLNPSIFRNYWDVNSGTKFFRPPFNRVSNFRDPGRVNLNTVNDRRVFDAIMANFHVTDASNPASLMPNYQMWRQSRRGYGNQGDSEFLVNSSSPTFFSNPLRAPGYGNMVPLASLERDDIETTLLRWREGAPNDPLFEGRTTNAAVNPHSNANRDSYFRYRNLQRLGNLTTSRSNVYAIWITVGFFEVQPNPTGVTEAYPDGYRLGQEVGLDTGDVRRHRAFYMVDRSIPVCFEPGQDRNVEQAIILQRFIE